MSILGYVLCGVSVAMSAYSMVMTRHTVREAEAAAARAEAALAAWRNERES